jgi:(1->4)-alpha-D-glucan 1-alpha-D-glucosylmutase
MNRSASAPGTPPRATVRLQIHQDFDLFAAAATVPYSAELGISHVYASPLQRARSGSRHGYDGVDPTVIDPARGGRAGLRELVAALRAHGMGLILDIVPNHLGTSLENPWWFDVLEHGRASRYAEYFAIDWDAPDAQLHGRVLAPFLAETPASLHARGALCVRWDTEWSRVVIDADGQRFPLRATQYSSLLAASLPQLARQFADADTHAEFAHAREQLAFALQTRSADAFVEHLARLSADANALLQCLDAQAYELADWREAAARINWRRFFDIHELIALRSEREEVFEACHALVFELYAAGEIDGVRIDHVDGLADPRAYCRRLRARLAGLEAQRPPDAPRGPAWIIVEKILADDEALRTDWGIDGSTGYDFMDQVGGLLHAADTSGDLDAAWHDIGGRAYADIAVQARREILADSFAPDFARAWRGACEALPAFAADSLQRALRALLHRYSRYRGYAKASETDVADLDALARAAQEASVDAGDVPALNALVALYRADMPDDRQENCAAARVAFQQLTPPLAARALEDTAFYRYARLLSRNEVGATPSRLTFSAEAFHAACCARAEHWPRSLLATASHDHKRGEDTRMRIASLTDIAPQWRAWLDADAGMAADALPDAIDRSMAYQTLLGILPHAGAADATEALRERLIAWARKSTRERKQHGSWNAPDAQYEDAQVAWLDHLLGSDTHVRGELANLLVQIEANAAVRSLSQLTLRCTTPGVPDLYQGTEFWDFSLVDPDNRVDVDYATRRAALTSPASDVELLASWRDGRVKQRLLKFLLKLRAQYPEVFAGTYRALDLQGPHADAFIAFAREAEGVTLVVIVPLCPAGLTDDALALDRAKLADTRVTLPLRGEAHILLAQRHQQVDGSVALADVFAHWPLGVLVFDTH